MKQLNWNKRELYITFSNDANAIMLSGILIC